MRNSQYNSSFSGNLDQLLSDHATSSKNSRFVSITQNPAAFYFAIDSIDSEYSVAIIQTKKSNSKYFNQTLLAKGTFC